MAGDRKASEGRSAAGLTVPVGATELPRARRSRPPQTPWEGGKGLGWFSAEAHLPLRKALAETKTYPSSLLPYRKKLPRGAKALPAPKGIPVRDESPGAVSATIAVSQASSLSRRGQPAPKRLPADGALSPSRRLSLIGELHPVPALGLSYCGTFSPRRRLQSHRFFEWGVISSKGSIASHREIPPFPPRHAPAGREDMVLGCSYWFYLMYILRVQ